MRQTQCTLMEKLCKVVRRNIPQPQHPGTWQFCPVRSWRFRACRYDPICSNCWHSRPRIIPFRGTPLLAGAYQARGGRLISWRQDYHCVSSNELCNVRLYPGDQTLEVKGQGWGSPYTVFLTRADPNLSIRLKTKVPHPSPLWELHFCPTIRDWPRTKESDEQTAR